MEPYMHYLDARIRSSMPQYSSPPPPFGHGGGGLLRCRLVRRLRRAVRRVGEQPEAGVAAVRGVGGDGQEQ